MDDMDAIEMLKAEHKAIKDAMAALARSASADRNGLFTAFKRDLKMHDDVEKYFFYPSINSNPKAFGFQGLDTETRRDIARAMKNLEALPFGSSDWFPYFQAIQGILKRQMDTEEFNVFERVREALTRDELEELGRRMVYERHQRVLAAAEPDSNRGDLAPQRRPSRSQEAQPKTPKE
jgi:hypothetical protein